MSEDEVELLDSELPEEHPYKKKKHRETHSKKPYCLYYYHITSLSGEDTIKHYYYSDDGPIFHDELDNLARDLGRNARDPYGAPPKHGSDFKDVYWRRISYLMFLIDIPGAKVKRNKDAISIVRKLTDSMHAPNHNFFDAEHFTVDLSDNSDGSQKRDVVVCINHMKKNLAGAELGTEQQTFNFTINLQSGQGGEARRITVPHSGGTNQGPAVPPPDE